jgi:hypothetical protein
MDEADRKQTNVSMGTNYTFRDKHGNLIGSSDRGIDTEGDLCNDRTADVPGLAYEQSKF